jgi:hypothetical protein
MKYQPSINNEELAQFANGDYEDRLTAAYRYKKRTESTMSLQDIISKFQRAYAEVLYK